MKNDSQRLVLVRTFGQDWQAHMAKALLAESGIESVIDNEVFSRVYPLGFTELGSVRLMVLESDQERAQELVGRMEFD